MLAKATVKITPQELETLKASLTGAREEIEARRRQKEARFRGLYLDLCQQVQSHR